MQTKEMILETATRRTEDCQKVKEMIVERLGLEIPPEFITEDQPLFGRGLELDSIDSLELAVGIFEDFSVSVTDDDKGIFSSVNTIVDFIYQNQ